MSSKKWSKKRSSEQKNKEALLQEGTCNLVGTVPKISERPEVKEEK